MINHSVNHNSHPHFLKHKDAEWRLIKMAEIAGLNTKPNWIETQFYHIKGQIKKPETPYTKTRSEIFLICKLRVILY